LRFREDILRGVRLFAIVFAAILFCVAAYRMLRTPSDVQGATQDESTGSEAAQPSPEPTPAPVSEAVSEVHPLIVPEPPPVGGTQKKVAHPRDPGVPPPPPPAATPTVARTRRAPAPSAGEFESSAAVALPAAPAEESPESKPLTPKQMVGYKSLIDATKNRPPAEYVAPAPDDEPAETAAKGNRFFRAIGKIFHPGGKKDAEPSTLQPKQQ
jgi:hypothetical protein